MRPCDYVIQGMFRIANKRAETVNFVLNKPQRRYSDEAGQFDIILKARREGFSSYILAEFTADCMSYNNTAAVVMSHEDEATKRHLARVDFYLKHWRGAEKVKKGLDSRNMITFPDLDSSFYIGTAGAKRFGRGDTITHLHLSEAAFYDRPRDIVGGALQAASHAKRVVIESTANGYNWFKKICEKAQNGRGKFKLHFFAWYDDPDNWSPVVDLDMLTEDDKDIQDNYNLSPEQMQWYIDKREEFMEDDDDIEGLRLFHQEYPCSPQEAFQSSGSQYIGSFRFEEKRPIVDGHLKVYTEPRRNGRYVIGLDISGGIGQDYFVAQIVDIDRIEQVAVYRDNWTTPAQAAHVAERLGKRFNIAYLIPEVNNHGHLMVEILKRIYPVAKIYQRTVPDSKARDRKRKVLGFITSMKSRFYLMDTLKLYQKRGLLIHDVQTFNELKALEEVDGRLQAPEGEFDDCAMSLGLACVGVKKLVKGKLTPHKPIEETDYSKPILPWGNLDELATSRKERWHEEGRLPLWH